MHHQISRSVLPHSYLPLLALILTGGCVEGDFEPARVSPESSAAALTAPVTGDYFILTHADGRLCPSPKCGGYFVKQANLASSRCADGSQASECHALRLDYSSSGMASADATRFEQGSFAARYGVIKASLVKSSTAEDLLVVTEAWQAQAHSSAAGFFSFATPSGIPCTSWPCESYEGARLNGPLVRPFNAVDLSGTGAPADTVVRGNQALNGAGLLVAGNEALIWNWESMAKDLRATEFYLRIPSCGIVDAQGVGTCAQTLGYRWDGLSCVAVTGCSCSGKDCTGVQTSLASCQSAHPGCVVRACGPGRPACGDKQYCDFPDGAACGTQPGECRARPSICSTVFKPVCGCDGKAYGSACEANLAGFDSREGACK